MKKVYMICSVRNITEQERLKINAYVAKLENEGHSVRLPYRDTNQNDEVGLRIVQEHEDDIIWADEIHVWWNRFSFGSHWDLGGARMAQKLMPKKRIVLANLYELEVDPHKSYANVMIALALGLDEKTPRTKLASILEMSKKTAKELRWISYETLYNPKASSLDQIKRLLEKDDSRELEDQVTAMYAGVVLWVQSRGYSEVELIEEISCSSACLAMTKIWNQRTIKIFTRKVMPHIDFELFEAVANSTPHKEMFLGYWDLYSSVK